MSAPSSSKPRVGIIGAGFGTLVHLPAFRSEGWEIGALCSRNASKVRKAADAAGVEAVYTDPFQLIERDDLAAVAISTPPASHHALVMAALNAGKHVVCEKPFAMSAPEAAEMRDTAAKLGRTAMVAHEFRFTPQRAYIKQLLADGYIGQFRMCTIELFLDRYVTKEPRALTWQARNADGGGLLGALGSHYIDGLRDWFGDVATASGRLRALRPDVKDETTGGVARAETDDTFTMTLDFVNGGFATMIASFAATPARGARIVVMGDEGTLVAEQDGPNPTENGVVLASRNGESLAALATPPQYTPFVDPRDHRLMAFRLLVKEFTKGIAQRISPHPDFTDGWRCQQVLDAVRASSESGSAVRLT